MLVRITIELDMKLGIFEDLVFYCRIKSCEVFEEIDYSQFVSAEELKQYLRMKSDREIYRRFCEDFNRSEWINYPSQRQEMFKYYFVDQYSNTKPYQEIYHLLGIIKEH